MIKIVNLTKKYNTRIALNHLNHQFPNKGLCIIYGPSGSGKTTLLNCIAGLMPYEGNIIVGHEHIEGFSDDQLSKLRLIKYGFVFQDFKLFENETVIANLLFPLETTYRLSKEIKIRKCNDLLSLVGLADKSKQIVNRLSGGEKQRVAIARSLVNDPIVVLADEPTASLDEKNGMDIMNILKIISKRSLVIMVSHDRELTYRYADQVIEMDEGKINKISLTENSFMFSNLPVLKNGVVNEIPHISNSFLFTHSLHNMKQKKGRTFICYSMTSIGLIGVGLAFALSSSIATNIKDAYHQIVDENTIMFCLDKKEGNIKGQYAASYYDVLNIKDKYKDYIDDVGVEYYVNFEKFFPDANNLVIVNNYRYCPIHGFSARHINDFSWLDDIQTTIYPETISSLENDEVILGLDYQSLIDICFELQIERNVSSLSDYLKRNEVYLYFDLVNFDWAYSDEQLVKFVGFTLENDIKIYHSNHLWNEYMFEQQMSFPSTSSISANDNVPWMLKKIYYLKTTFNQEELLNLLYKEKLSDKLIFEIASDLYYPWLYYETKVDEINRILVFNNTIAHIPLWHVNHILANDDNLKEPIIGTIGGYFIYPESLMMGFSKTMYFSKEIDLLESIIDYQTSNATATFYQENLPDNVLSGNFANTLQNGVQFDICPNNLISGRMPNNLDEIALSYQLYKELNLSQLNETIYVATSKKQILVDGNKLINDFVLIPIKVVGVIKNNSNSIYHNLNWPILFFQCKVGVSAFDLQCQNLAFHLKNSEQINESILQAQKAFKQYEIINPLSDINDSVDEVCFYITIVLIVFSLITTIISILLLTICNYLYILDERKEIALARCIGLNKKESKRFLYAHSFMQCIVSFLVASFELFVFSILCSLEIGNALNVGFNFSFNVFSLVPMLILAISISFLSSVIMSKRINSINPLDAMKA